MAANDPFLVKTMFGLEPVLAQELEQLGAKDIVQQNRAVSFTGDTAMLYKANLHLRTALRILVPIGSFIANNEEQLYKGIREFNWLRHLGPDDTLAVDAAVHSREFTHSKYVALKTKDAIVDQIRDMKGTRPSVDIKSPTVRINIHIQENHCNVSLDSSGDSLHRRGYRLDMNPAPLNEVLAAGLVLLSGWDATTPFADPMCGSGTILTEAAMLAYNIAPGTLRAEFGFQRWRDYEPELWDTLFKEALLQVKEDGPEITGADISGMALQKAGDNLKRAHLAREVALKKSSFEHFVPETDGGTVIINPPYGERLKEEDIEGFYKMIGDQLKQKFAGHTALILSGNMEALKFIGLKPSRKIPLYNGSIECRFCRYDLYAGSRR
ncbi:MAG: THUMP domain-containing protein [Bacteroidia bacterium]